MARLRTAAALLLVVVLAGVAMVSMVRESSRLHSSPGIPAAAADMPPPNELDEKQVVMEEEKAEEEKAVFLRPRAPPSQNTTEPTAASSPGLLPFFTVAYCTYDQDQRKFDPIGHSEWLARWFGPHVFPDLELRVIPCRAGPKYMTKEEHALPTAQQVDLLGLGQDVDVRLCRFGSSEVIQFIKSAFTGDCDVEWLFLRDIVDRATKAGRGDVFRDVVPDAGGWTNDRRLYWPPRLSQLRCKSGRRLPFLIRHNHEPWFEEVIGVGAQMDGKLESLSGKSLTIYLPLIIDSFGWRWVHGRPEGTTNHWTKRLGGAFDTLADQGTRPAGFNASRVLAQKQYFAASINSHCAGPGAYLPSTLLRELFTFVLAEVSHKPVHHLGTCPLSLEDRVTRSGLSMDEYTRISRTFHPLSTVEAYSAHKFAVVFENGRKSGYVTEKSVNAYAGHAVPIYFGPEPDHLLTRVLNLNAVIYCDIPTNISVKAVREWSQCLPKCQAEFRERVERATRPYLVTCAEEVMRHDRDDELWKSKVAQNLAPVDPRSGELSGVWDGKVMGGIMRDALRALDYRARRR